MRPRYAAALSEHPLATQAVGETVGGILDQLAEPPDLVVTFATEVHTGVLEDVTRAVRSILNPRILIGSNAESVIGGSQEVEGGSGIALFAARFDTEILPIRLEAFTAADGSVLVAGGGGLEANDGTLLLVADPATFPIADVVGHLNEVVPGVGVVGGMCSAGPRHGGGLLLLDDERFRDGAVGVLLPSSIGVSSFVSQGCSPFGQPMVVTRADGNIVHELAGRPALERLMEQVDALDPAGRATAARGLHVGIAVDEHVEDFGPGDFLIRGVLGADRSNGAVAVGGSIDVGTTIQFHLRDAHSAHQDLLALASERDASGLLTFTCNGRGRGFFGEADHDARLLAELFDGAPLAGMSCAGEVGPVGARTHLHSFSAAVALFP